MTKPSLAFVVDEPAWAFDRWTQALAERLRQVGVHVTRYFRYTLPEVLNEDILYVCWWPDVELVAFRRTHAQCILCRITDMATWNKCAPIEWRTRFETVVPSVDTFVAASLEIETELRSLGLNNVVRFPDCVDVELFRDKRFARVARPIVGWCGNPNALDWMGFTDIKGFSVVKSLHGHEDIVLSIATNVPFKHMPDWYRSIDIYLCASKIEGTPLTILEAMASGNIVVSTPVGVVPEIRSPGVFLFDGTADSLRAAIEEVLRRRPEWDRLGAANRKCAERKWSSSYVATTFARWLVTEVLQDESIRCERL